jgi:hypothetical protein
MVCRVRRGRHVSSAAALCISLLAGCEAKNAAELSVSEASLKGMAGAAAVVVCVPVDTKDTVPDRIDEDCDGRIDEDVDATRADCPRDMHVIEGTRGNDTLHGTSGRDCILGYGGNDTLYGESGDDVIFGGPGDDRIFTGKGRDLVRAGSGADNIDSSSSFASTVYGEAGADVMLGGSGVDVFFGGADNDVLKGGGGSDLLNGGDCHDMLVGSSGLDMGAGGRDFDACDTELTTDCERTGTSRVLCTVDTDCRSTERCAVNSRFCVPRSAAVCGANTCTPTRAVDDTCNGVDDDCDGVIDDNYVAISTQCGAGACSATGMASCVNGAVVDSCRTGSALPGNDASCDAVDDDCDGRVDEGFAATATSCGLGVCLSHGTTSCLGGAVIDSCSPGLPAAASDTSCNGLDDDCDGSSDEDFVAQGTHCGLGVCASTGTSACNAGVASDTCQPGAPTAEVDDSCNALDDDCNGMVDEAYTARDTTCGFGACLRHGTTSCSSGHEADSCHVDCEGQCNDGAEDDADGVVDCADSDCASAVGCVAGGFGSSCEVNSDCTRVGSQATCFLGFPGGYCSHFCSLGCPAGTKCLDNTVCVLDCGPGNHCGRTGFECSAVTGYSPTPWCHPTCAISCPSGQTCDPMTVTCH